MNNTTINGALLKEMFLTGAALLEKNKAYVDSLNVFPVPDGDTGTNMSMTMQSAVKEIKACNGGSTVGDQPSRRARSNCQMSQMCEKSSIPRSASGLRNSGSNTMVDSSALARPL